MEGRATAIGTGTRNAGGEHGRRELLRLGAVVLTSGPRAVMPVVVAGVEVAAAAAAAPVVMGLTAVLPVSPAVVVAAVATRLRHAKRRGGPASLHRRCGGTCPTAHPPASAWAALMTTAVAVVVQARAEAPRRPLAVDTLARAGQVAAERRLTLQ